MLRAAATRLAVPAAAVVAAIGVAAGVLAATGANPGVVLGEALAYGLRPTTLVAVVDKAVPYYLAGIAAAIGFHLRLFNIGIDGQYRLGAFAAAVVGAAVVLPGPLHVALIVTVAVAVGAGWAALAGWLRVRRGVDVVITTIMLNAVATGLIAYLLSSERFAEQLPGSNNVATARLPETAWIPAIPTPAGDVGGLIVLALAAGVGYWFAMSRTTVGFEIRALGRSMRAGTVAGMPAGRLLFLTMCASGAVAGLVGLPQLLGGAHRFGLDFPAGLGFTGLAVAILGRNHSVGIAIAAIAWAFLERSAQVFDLSGVSREVVTIIQAVAVLAFVVAQELAGRRQAALERRRAAAAEGPA